MWAWTIPTRCRSGPFFLLLLLLLLLSPPLPSSSSAMSPPSFTLNVRALLTLPYRLCNPPPAAGNVRSCKVTPLIKVSLDDVLNKRHLPPLTLKDFEEWLVFVEGCPQYLYFLLWLKEYEARYATWLADSGYASPPKSLASTFSLSSSATPQDLTDSSIAFIPPSASLALFFTRAKQTFLDLDAPYALGPAALASIIRAPSTHSLSPSIPHFATSPAPLIPEVLTSHPHPHPRELAPLASHARTALKARLERFATSACTNVGTRRAWCGVAGGATIMLFLGVLPALIALFFAKERWWRVFGWAGCWLGGTIVLASFHGICMMIYVFGDLRQLRSFELARPPISPPRAIARARPRLRSYFTSTPDDAPGPMPMPMPSHNPDSDVKSPRLDHNLKVRIPVAISTKNEGSVSETSTGTPVVNFDPGMNACVLSEETTLGIHISTMIRETDHVQRTNGDGDTGDEEECVIEISPAYYPEGSGLAASREGEGGNCVTATMLQSVRSGPGRVMEWVRRVSGAGIGSLVGTVDHVGTFGVKRGAGSLSPRGQVDAEAGRAIFSEGEFGEKAEMDEVTEEAGWVRTAEFITRECEDGDGREVRDAEKAVVEAEPVEFDFDKLPDPVPAVSPAPPSRPVSAVISSPSRAHSHSHTRSMSLPHISYPHAPSPGPPPAQALPPLPLNPLLTPSPRVSLYPHPDVHILPSSPSAPSLFLSPFPALPPAPERQWWDTCPRHPAVAASLSATRASSPRSSAIHSRPHSHAYPLPIDPRPLTSRSNPLSPSTDIPTSPSTMASSNNDPDADSWRKRLALVTRVPAFGPLTRVLSPVAARGQWEIVVRSAAVAAVGAWFFIGGLVALPEVGG